MIEGHDAESQVGKGGLPPLFSEPSCQSGGKPPFPTCDSASCR